MNELWLVSVPGEQYSNLDKIPADVGHIKSDFRLPELKVGTLDTLIQLSDDLNKADTFGESTCRKVASYMIDILDGDQAQAVENLKMENGRSSPSGWTCQFKWDAAKYPSRLALPQLLGVVNRTLSEVDAATKKKSAHYNQIRNSLAQYEKRSTASLVTRPLTDVIKASDLVQASEYLETLFVAVPRRSEDDWIKSYETITDMIVPRSSRKIISDADYALFSITLFRRAIPEFRTECSKRKFIVRDYQYSADDVKNDKAQFESLDQEKRKTYPILFKWLKVNFTEAYSAWMHIKALRVFVESVLRYGLPVNFRAAALVPGKNHRKLRQHLNKIFADLDSSAFSSAPVGEDVGGLKFDSGDYFPYVFCRVPTDVVE